MLPEPLSIPSIAVVSPPAERPYVLLNMAMSLDGKISTAARESFMLGSRADAQRMDQLRAQADALLNGVRTIRDDNPPVRVASPELRRQRTEQGRGPTPAVYLLSGSGNFPAQARVYQDGECGVTLCFPESLLEHVERGTFPDSVEFLPLPDDEPLLPGLLREMHRRGVRLLLAEGGAELNWSLFAADVVDEFFLTVTPWVIGGSQAPTPVGGSGLSREQMLRYELMSCEPLGDELYLRYRRKEMS